MDISRMKKHIGVLNNTGVRVVVVFRKVPGEEDKCLIVETERLPDMYHDNIIECVNSREAQETNEFFEILNRRTMSDGLNALQALHYKGFLRKVPIELVSLIPLPGQKLPLDLLNAQIDGTMDQYTEKENTAQVAAADELAASNPMGDPSDPAVIAKGILLQADLLEAEAKAKRQEAYALAPELMAIDPANDTKKRGRPTLSEDEKAIKAEERKVKRRERDREKAAEKRAAKAEATQAAKIDDKIVRDAARQA